MGESHPHAVRRQGGVDVHHVGMVLACPQGDGVDFGIAEVLYDDENLGLAPTPDTGQPGNTDSRPADPGPGHLRTRSGALVPRRPIERFCRPHPAMVHQRSAAPPFGLIQPTRDNVVDNHR